MSDAKTAKEHTSKDKTNSTLIKLVIQMNKIQSNC